MVLRKGEKGLGFSILDYQDPCDLNNTVIVVRGLVPGGAAHQDGRIIPGDRVMFVNQTQLTQASLDLAVQALKGAPLGLVRVGVCKPRNTDALNTQDSLVSTSQCVRHRCIFFKEILIFPHYSPLSHIKWQNFDRKQTFRAQKKI